MRRTALHLAACATALASTLTLALTISGCGSALRSPDGLALVTVETGSDAVVAGQAIGLPGGGALVTYGDALDGQPAIRARGGELRALRDYIGWGWATALVAGTRVTAVLVCHSDAPPQRLLVVGSEDGGGSWDRRLLAAPPAPASGPGARTAHQEFRLAIREGAAGDPAETRSVRFISEDGGRMWWQMADGQ
jgi:hypothetical protein